MPQSYTEGQRLQGSDGNIYVVHNGTPVLESSVAPSGAAAVVGTPDPTQPYKAPEVQAKIANTNADTAATTAKTPYIPRQAAADVKNKELTNTRLEQEIGSGPPVQSPQLQQKAQVRGALNLLDNLDKQESLWRDKYANNGMLDTIGRFFNTPTNSNFDQYSKNELVSGKAFLRVPGEGSSSDRDVTNYTDLLPNSWSFDQTNINRFRNLREQANQILMDNGLAPRSSNVLTPDGRVYTGPIDSQGRPAATVSQSGPTSGGNNPGGSPPPDRPDGSAPIAGGTAGGDTLSLSQGDYTSRLVDPPAKVQASFRALLNGNPSDDQVRAWGSANGYDVGPFLDARRKNPSVAPTLGKTIVREPLTTFNKYLNAAAQSDFGAGVISAGDAVTGGWLDNLTSNPEQTRQLMDLSGRVHPISTVVGNLAGGALATAGLEGGTLNLAGRVGLNGARVAAWAPRIADATYGAINGAGTADDGNRLVGAGMGGTLGLGGGMFGRTTTRGVGSGVRGIRDTSVQYLRQNGVPLTVGQAVSQSGIIGRSLKGLEDRLSGFSGVGDVINGRRLEGYNAFNRAAFREGGAPIGFNPTNIGEAGVDDAVNASRQAYGNAVNGASVTPDAQFGQDVTAVVARGSRIPRTGPEFSEVVNSDIAPHFSSSTGAIDGSQIQDILQRTRDTSFGTDAMGTRANDALKDVGGAVSDLVSRQNPNVIPQLQAANAAYRRFNILADAVGRGANTGGIFTPAQLGLAARANAGKFGGKLAAASEDRPFFDLQRAGQDVLPSQVPDSGTAGRLGLYAIPTLVGGVGGGGYGAVSGDPVGGTSTGAAGGLLTGLALAAGGSRGAQRVLTSMLLDRPDAVVRFGNKIVSRQGMFGRLGTAGSQELLPLGPPPAGSAY